ncbi:hypothetical protein ACFQX8_23465 [Klenkia terrae]|uniref:hypothetical protein n=1 Tax=Klenkia terrae TaxID=1052259 RepID=UPI003611E026
MRRLGRDQRPQGGRQGVVLVEEGAFVRGRANAATWAPDVQKPTACTRAADRPWRSTSR